MGFERVCSDPRDRIYGLVGLMPEGLQRRIVSDYTLSVGEIYRRATLEVIGYFSRLDLLRRFTSIDPTGKSDTPSWVPDLIPKNSGNRGDIQFQFSAGMSRCEVQYSSPNVLSVQGVKGGVVVDVKPRLTSELKDGLKEAVNWRPENHDQSYPGGGTMLEAHLMAMAGMQLQERFPNPSVYPTLEECKQYCYYGPNGGQSSFDQYTMHIFELNVASLLFKRTMFTTQKGHIGLGPVQMRSGMSKTPINICADTRF